MPIWLLVIACVKAPEPVPASPGVPYVVVLGTAQDGGVPQIGCTEALCEAARRDPARGRLTVAALLVDPRSGRRWLFDAGPDLPRHVEAARGHGGPPPGASGRPPLFDGIFVTHAHTGHYLGLAHLGREAYGTQSTPLFASPALGNFLTTNGPWSLLFDAGHLEHVVMVPGQRVELAADLSVVAHAVPHRPEFSDTVAFQIRGPERTLLYLPDIDAWDAWDRELVAALDAVDVALVDATFFDGSELPGRDLSTIPHPFAVDTMARLADTPAATRDKVHLLHLNHSNPLVDPDGPEAARVREAGLHVAREGDVHPL